MRRLPLVASIVLVLAMTGCSATDTPTACDEVERAAKKATLTAADAISGPLNAGTLETAAAEMEEYLAPLRDLEPQGDLAEPYADLVEGMDEMVVAIRAGDRERIAEISGRLTLTAVDIDIACR